MVGCGTGEYERRLEDRHAEKTRIETKLSGLYLPLVVPGTTISVRLPKSLFPDPPLVEGAMVGGKPVDVRRVKPQKLVTIPGLKLTYEGFIESEGGKLPCYCYVGVIDVPMQAVEDPSVKMRAELSAQQPPPALTNWQDVSLETPSGQPTVWRKLRAENSQEFYTLDKAGQGEFKNLPGVLEIYFRVEPKNIIVIAWRVPLSIDNKDKVDLKKWAALVAECVSVNKAVP
jgi:hypothetical protein